MIRAVPVGVGSYLPKRVLSNDDLSHIVNTSDEWIRKRTGISQRHIAANDEFTCDLAYKAARQALHNANLAPEAVHTLILATTTPDHTFPATAPRVQAMLGMKESAAFDIQAACGGFLYGMALADGLIRAGTAHTVLVVGAEILSRLLDWTDRSTCVLFGDGAGAVVFQAREGDEGLLATHTESDGAHYASLFASGGVTTSGHTGHVRMQGKHVFLHGVEKMVDALQKVTQKAHIPLSRVDWLVPHQANIRIIKQLSQRLAIPMEQVIVSIASHGNVSTATVPLALSTCWRHFRPGDLVAFVAMGGGFSWGAALIRWPHLEGSGI